MPKAILDVKCPKCNKEYKVVYGRILNITCECGEKIQIKPQEDPIKEKKKGKKKK